MCSLQSSRCFGKSWLNPGTGRVFCVVVSSTDSSLTVMLYQDADLTWSLPLKEAFCSYCLCLVWLFLRRQELLITYGPAILIACFVVEVCDCLKAERVWHWQWLQSDSPLISFRYGCKLWCTKKNHLKIWVIVLVASFGDQLVWRVVVSTSRPTKCCLLKLGILVKVTAIKRFTLL